MKCIICGSRTIDDYELLKQAIAESKFQVTEIVSGCASGADLLGEKWAVENGLKIHKFPADWQKYGKYAGFLRNKEMIKFISESGCVIALWDGKSKGTAHTIKLAKEAGIPCFVKSP